MKTIITLLLAIAFSHHSLAQSKDTTDKKSGRQLQTVTVTGKKLLIRQEADRIIYDLRADAQSKVSSVLDMMRKVPYLSVDGDDNILLKGSLSYRVFINGHPSGLVTNNLKAVLRSMPASTVKSIEVITNPPARYDAEGLAGIINIITIRQEYNGYKGSVNINEKWPAGGPGIGSSFTLKHDRLGFSLLAGTSDYKVPETGKEVERTTTETDPTSLYQQTTSHTNSQTAYAGLELSYELDSLNLITGEFNWNANKSKLASTQVSAFNEANYQQYYRLNNGNDKVGKGIDATMNYQRGFKSNKNRLLTFSYQYLKDNNVLYNDIIFSDRINYLIPDYRQYNSENVTGHIIQVDYMQPIKNLTVEGGLKESFRANESNFRYLNFNSGTGEYEMDTTRSNIFNNSQSILAAYNSYAYATTDWQIKAGIRAEETIFKIGYSSGFAPLQREYMNVLPVIVVSRKFKNNSSLSFSFSARVQRPMTAELNPFVDRSNPNFESSGNPYLHPITSNVYQLSYLRTAKATLNVSLGGMFFNNVFSAFPFYDSATNSTLTRYENYGRGRVLKTNIFLNYPVKPNLTFTLNSDIRYITVDGMVNSLRVRNSGFNAYVNASGGYSFKQQWRVNADITYNMGGLSLPLGKTNGFVATSFGLSKDIIRSKLTAAAAINNPFTRYRNADETINGPNFLQTSHSQSYYRRFTVSLNYNFGKLKEEIRKNKRGIKNDDSVN